MASCCLIFFNLHHGCVLSECLAGGILSQKAEVYSYGIFLLELITRKKPVFSGVAIDADLHMWVQRVLPLQGLQIVDQTLLNTTYNYENVFSLIFLALSCTEEVQDNRPEISNVITTLKQLKTIESGETHFSEQAPFFFFFFTVIHGFHSKINVRNMSCFAEISHQFGCFSFRLEESICTNGLSQKSWERMLLK
jgi:hypothetical protein